MCTAKHYQVDWEIILSPSRTLRSQESPGTNDIWGPSRQNWKFQAEEYRAGCRRTHFPGLGLGMLE